MKPRKFADPNSPEAQEYYAAMKHLAETGWFQNPFGSPPPPPKSKPAVTKNRPVSLDTLWRLTRSVLGQKN